MNSSPIRRKLRYPAKLGSLWHQFCQRLKRAGIVAILLVGVWLSAASAGWAQEPSSPENETPSDTEQAAPTRSTLGADDISLDKVSHFVRAYLQVLNLVEKREDELRSAETESESFQIQQEIESDALQIIEGEDLTWQEYLQLLRLANTDPAFGERVVTQLQESSL